MPDRETIIFTTDGIGRGGKERQITLLAKHLSQKFDVFILSVTFDPNNYLEEYGFPSSNIVVLNDKSKGAFKEYVKFVKQFKNCYIFAFDSKTAFWVLLSHRFFGQKFVNCSIRHGIRGRKFSHYLRTLILWFSPYVIANSEAGLKANQLTESDRNFILYNANPLIGTSFESHKKDSVLLQKYFGKEDLQGKVIFISVANFVPYKDYETVIKGLAIFRKQSDFKYLIIGNGPLKGYIQTLIESHNLVDNVFIVGPTKDVFEHLSVADVFIHSSKGEGISNAILEAMIAGLPVIATAVGGNAEILHPQYSRTFEYKDVDGFVRILINELEELRSLSSSKEVLHKHLQKFSVSSTISKFEYIITKIG